MADISDQNLTLELMLNPLNLQKLVLDDIESRFNGKYTFVDPNFTAMHLIEMQSNLTSNLANIVEQNLSTWLALRAQTSEDLYKHMSDYDYVNVFSSPASAEILISLDKNYLVNHALDYNDNYKLVIIPETTVFKLGLFECGIYYPIHIKINKHTKYVTVTYDTTKNNPLFTIDSNLLSSTEYEYLGTTFLQIAIPVYQFSHIQYSEAVTPKKGFAKKYTFRDKFYAARIFTNKDSKLIELNQALSKTTYDPYIATARLQVSTETSSVSINIPQVYLNNNLIGSKLIVDLFTTKGNIENNIASLDYTQMFATFNLTSSSSEFSKILQNIPTLIISPVSEKFAGGFDGLTFEELRSRVVNNSFQDEILITPIDLENYFSDKGFRILKYQDDLTNLIYFAYKILSSTNGTIIPSSSIDIQLCEDSYNECSTIKHNVDGTLTVLPKTLYRYEDSSLSCIPVSDIDRNQIATMSTEEQINLFNTSTYTKSPFHIRLIPSGRYPYVSSYNLMDPTITNFIFDKENESITAMMTTTGGAIYHMDEGAGGYKLRLICKKSLDLQNIPEDDIIVYLYTKDINNVSIGVRLNHIQDRGVDESVYEIDLKSSYHITKDHHLSITTLTSTGTLYDHYVEFSQQYYIVFLVKTIYFPEATTEPSMFEGVSNIYNNNTTVMLRQRCTIKLGYALDDVIYNSINLEWTGQKYKTYETDVPLLHTTDIYETDDKGIPVYTIVNGKLTFNKLHSIGDPVYNDTGQPIYKYKKGEIIKDINGNPIIEEQRVLKYLIQTLMIDAKLYISEHPVDVSFREALTKTLETYFGTIRAASPKMLERDKVYFKPVRTLGSALFDIGDGVKTTLPLNISIKYKIHLDDQAYANPDLQDLITDTVIKEINTALVSKRVSLTEIAISIQNKISYITAIDVLGICDNVDLQTISIVDDSVQPALEQILYITKDNAIRIKEHVDIEYVLGSKK